MIKPKKLSFDVIADLLDYFPETGELLWRNDRSQRAKKGDRAGHRQKNGYHVVGIDGSNYKAHRIAWVLHYGFDTNMRIDHVNGDRSDNRIDNLRECTNQQNNNNRGPSAISKSGYRGVTRVTCHKELWQASVRVLGKQRYLGCFPSKELAAEFSQLAREMLHGQFAGRMC